MHAITVDAAVAAGLAAAMGDVEIRDDDGVVLGLFVPEFRGSASPAPGDVPPGRVRLHGVAAEKLRAAEAESKIRDGAGWLLGHFLRYPAGGRDAEPGGFPARSRKVG